MPFSSGVFSRLFNWVTEQATPPISIADLDTQEEDFSTAFNNCILRDGTGVPSAATPWNGQRISDLGAPTTDGDAANYQTGTFTATLGNCTTAPTVSMSYRICGGVCTLWVPSTLSGTANDTALTVTGLPSICRPSAQRFVPCLLTDNSIACMAGAVLIANSTTLTFYLMIAQGSLFSNTGNSSFTNGATKGIPSFWTVTYPL